MDFSLTTRDILLFGHVGAAIVLIGPLIVAASLFPRYITSAIDSPGEIAVARALHRITRGYNNADIVVALLGVGLAFESDLWSEPFVTGGIGIFLVASVLIFAVILPGQANALRLLANGADVPAVELATIGAVISRLRAVTGITSLLWAALLFLMVVKPS